MIDSGYPRDPRSSVAQGHRIGIGGFARQQVGHRTPPPDSTGAELNYILKQIEARTPMVIKLAGGELVRGVIEYYDREILKLTRATGPHLLLRRENILYMHKDEDGRRGNVQR